MDLNGTKKKVTLLAGDDGDVLPEVPQQFVWSLSDICHCHLFAEVDFIPQEERIIKLRSDQIVEDK